MTEDQDFPPPLWSVNLETLDQEIARQARLCRVRLLDSGVFARTLQQDASVCGTDNPLAFAKLRELLMLHLALRKKSLDAEGDAMAEEIQHYVIERLRKAFPGFGEWPPS